MRRSKFEGVWKPVERLPRDRIQRFQEVLVAQGHDVGKVDGLAGFKTRAAIGVTRSGLACRSPAIQASDWLTRS